MNDLKDLEKRMRDIEDRNKEVEIDKAWELSYSRNVPKPWLNAIVPAMAFMLSTLTLPFFKRLWIKYKIK